MSPSDPTATTTSETQAEPFRIVQSGSTEEEVLRVVDPDATSAEIRSGMSGCVVHLCGCK